MKLAIILTISSLLAPVLISLLLRLLSNKNGYVRLPKFMPVLGGLLFLVGLIFTPLFSSTLKVEFKTKFWPTTDGIVRSSLVIGNRAFRPDIEYMFIVNNDTLRGKSLLNQPGFGGRMNRLDAAEKNARKYKVGTVVKVFYNPKNHKDSTLSPGPTYASFLKLGSAVILLFSGTLILTLALFQPKRKKAR